MSKFLRWATKQLFLIVVLTFLSLAIGAIINKEDAAQLTNVQNQMQTTLKSMDPWSVWNRYAAFLTSQPDDASCPANVNGPACFVWWSQHPTFKFSGPVTQWIGSHLTLGYLRSLAIAVGAFFDLIWATFWQPGIVSKTVGLIQIVLGMATTVWLFRLLFDDGTEGSAPWENPIALPFVIAAFCMASVFFASGLAWGIYGFGTLVEETVGAIAKLGRLAATTASYVWLALQCLGIGLEHKLDAGIEALFARVAALFQRPA
jgi:hypothetical protein